MFSLALAVSEMYTFYDYDLQKVRQGHGISFSPLHSSMANVKIYKCIPYIIALALTVS